MAHQKYVFEKNWQVLFRDLNIPVNDILRHAQLPLDLLSKINLTITAEEYFRLWDSIEYMLRADASFPLKFGQAASVESFSPPIFACVCSPNFNSAMQRLARYKPLVGPIKLEVTTGKEETLVEIQSLSETPLPGSLIAAELVFVVHIFRLATREHILPLSVHTTADIPEPHLYEKYFGIPLLRASFDGLVFSAEDANKPFLTANDAMWAIFEPGLQTRIHNLEKGSNFRERVRACLMEILASGQCSVSDVAQRLAVSTRTLQRRLRDEGTSFQKELDTLREELAHNYLAKSDYTSGQIAFLLGYANTSSFFRAFRS